MTLDRAAYFFGEFVCVAGEGVSPSQRGGYRAITEQVHERVDPFWIIFVELDTLAVLPFYENASVILPELLKD